MGLLDAASSAVGFGAKPKGDDFRVPSRDADGPVLSWVGQGKAVFVEVDAIPTFTDSRAGKVTDFALEDGTSIADHFIRNAQTIKLEINQTQTPIENHGGKFKPSLELAQMTLTLPKNNFKPSGLLLATTAVGAALGAVAGALGSLVGIDTGEKPFRATVLKSKTNADRINALYDELDKAYSQVGQFTLTWLGRTWGPLVLEQLDYSRAAGRQLGVFSLTFKKITFVSTASAAALQIPAELTMKLPKDAGSVPAKALKGGSAKSASSAARASNPPLEPRYGGSSSPQGDGV
jgi:hypothetical protein